MSMEDKIVFCTGGGCTAKLGAGVLSRILEKLPRGEKDPDLLVGYDSRDDAAVYRITDDIALVQTVDFFPPMVDDPYTFGQIAAANALSDVYAMGGEVKTALNLVCFPECCTMFSTKYHLNIRSHPHGSVQFPMKSVCSNGHNLFQALQLQSRLVSITT